MAERHSRKPRRDSPCGWFTGWRWLTSLRAWFFSWLRSWSQRPWYAHCCTRQPARCGRTSRGPCCLPRGQAFLGGVGVWMMIVGRWIWSGHDRSRSVLLVTHGLLLVVGSVAVGIGVWATQAAEHSGANGGGLLGPVAVIPLLIAGPVLVWLCGPSPSP